MSNRRKRLGQLLLDGGYVTKRQIAKAVQRQIKGDDRKLGEILVDLSYITVDDLTDVMLDSEHAVETPITPALQKELSEDTKFNISIKTMISIAVGIATVVGFYYVLKSDIEEAKTLPAPGVGSYPSLDLRDPSVAWPPSKHQYNDQYDNMVDAITDLEEEIEELNDKVRDLELKVARLEK